LDATGYAGTAEVCSRQGVRPEKSATRPGYTHDGTRGLNASKGVGHPNHAENRGELLVSQRLLGYSDIERCNQHPGAWSDTKTRPFGYQRGILAHDVDVEPSIGKHEVA
jgi:hypothetical protein